MEALNEIFVDGVMDTGDTQESLKHKWRQKSHPQMKLESKSFSGSLLCTRPCWVNFPTGLAGDSLAPLHGLRILS